jgi:hypothetical protein
MPLLQNYKQLAKVRLTCYHLSMEINAGETKSMPSSWANKLIVCDKCGQTSMKTWAKQTEQGTLCQRCHPSVVGFLHPYMD